MKSEQLVEQSLLENLYYLRTIREYCADIQASFFENNQEYITTAEDFARRCEELGERVINIADGKINEFALNSEIFVTKYTLECEKETERLFGIDINTTLTERELTLTSGAVENPSQELITEIQNINKDALVITKNFISFCQEIKEKLENSTLFSYAYPSFYGTIIKDTTNYQNELERLIKNEPVDPTSAIDYEILFNEYLRDCITFIRSWTDPIHLSILEDCDELIKNLTLLINLYQNTDLTPYNQQQLSAQSLKVVDLCREFLSRLITQVLESKVYCAVVPITLDNFYTGANFYRYNLLASRPFTETTES